MKISYNWLKQYIDTDLNAHALAEKITSVGLEVDDVTRFSTMPGNLADFTIGEVKEVWQHPNADKLSVTKVDIGADNLLQVVCGAPNVAAGQKVAVATVGTRVSPLKGEAFTIKASKIRGEASEGMLCAEDELGISDDHDGIMVLGNDAQVGKPLTTYLIPHVDYTIEIGLTPNRADAASHLGVARDLAALFGQKINYPVLNTNLQVADAASGEFSVQIEEPELCPRYSALVIRNVKVQDSPDWLKNALLTIGLTPINNIVDATNFVMYEVGQPMHAFDLSRISGNKIIVKRAEAGSTFVTLDKQARKLDGTELMICNANEPMALAGVFGGLNSGITADTQDILLESAYFSPSAVRAASRKHQLFTDASFRFERGTDPNICVDALRRIADIILQIAGGEIQQPAIDVYPNPIAPKIIHLPYELVDKVAGTHVPREAIRNILAGLEIRILQQEENGLQLQIPTAKYDVTRPIDVIEEILRIYSFDKIPVPQKVTAVLQVNKLAHRETRRKRVSDYLVSNGFYESYHLSFVKESENQLISEDIRGVKVLNPLSAELEYMRTSTLVTGLKSVAYNLNRQQSSVKFFKWGTTFNLDGEAIAEKKVLSMWLTGNTYTANWHTKAARTDFFLARAYIENVLQLCNVTKYSTEAFSGNSIYAYGLHYMLKGEIVATVGLVNKQICRELDINQEVFFIEADAAFVLESGKQETRYNAISRYPRVERDISLTVPEQVSYSQIRELVNKLNYNILKKMYIFDVYQGEQVKEGYKSYAIRLAFEDPNKTLEDKVVDKMMSNITNKLESELQIEIRK